MRRTIAVLSISLTMLAGCSSHRSHADAAPAGLPSDLASAPGAGPSPSGLGATAASGTDAGATSGPGTGTGTGPGAATAARPAPTATVSRPAGRPIPPIIAVQGPWIQGKVSRGGIGPCYGFVTSAGVTYAVYSATSFKLTPGQRIRARLTPGRTPVACGTGKPARLEHLQIAG